MAGVGDDVRAARDARLSAWFHAMTDEGAALEAGVPPGAYKAERAAHQRLLRIADGRSFIEKIFGKGAPELAVFSDLHLLAVGEALAAGSVQEDH